MVDGGGDIISRRFWARYLRLNIPIACTIIFSYLLYKYDLYENILAGNISDSKWLTSYFSTNNLEFTDALKAAAYGVIAKGNSALNPPLWSLKIEFIGSIILLGIYSVKPRGFDVLILAISCFFMWIFFKSNSIYYMCFFFGAIMGKTKVKFGFLTFSTGYFLGAFVYEHGLYDWLPRIYLFDTKTFYNTCGAVLMVLSLVSGFGKTFFESSIPRFLGRISFSLYLIHFLILCSVTSFLYLALPKNLFGIVLNLAVYVSICFGLAMIYESLIDAKAVNFSRKVSSKLVISFANYREKLSHHL